MSQQAVLAEFRSSTSKDDPPFYSCSTRHDSTHIWLNVNGNVGWYRPTIEDGTLIRIRGEGQQPEGLDPSPEDTKALDYQTKWLSPKQRAKIVEAVQLHENGTRH